MPGQHRKQVRGLKPGTGRGGIPHPGEGGYGYPRGPYGKTGFPGSTPASLSRIPKSQTEEGRRDRQLPATAAQVRDTGAEFQRLRPWITPKPQPSYGDNPFRPGGQPDPNNRFIKGAGKGTGVPRQPRVRLMERSTAPERREIPDIGDLRMVNHKEVRNDIARRIWAVPQAVREYRPAPNPGKTGAHLMGPSQYHPGTMVYGDPDGGPIPAMPYNPDMTPPTVTVQSRFYSLEGAQEGYAMNRPPLFSKGGKPARIPPGANPHIRGARMSGQRYFGALIQQQEIGLPSDSYGIARRRGPRHRPVRFQVPAPWTTSYYDVAPEQGEQAPDMTHQSPAGSSRERHNQRRQAARKPRRG